MFRLGAMRGTYIKLTLPEGIHKSHWKCNGAKPCGPTSSLWVRQKQLLFTKPPSTFSYFSASLQLHGDMSPVLTTSGLKHRKISTKASVSTAAMTSEVVLQV